MATREFIHPLLHRPVESISGHYEYIEENTVEVDGKKLLYLGGYSITDRSCCGTGGCIFVSIPGYVIDFRHTRKDDGTVISTVEPVVDEMERSRIRRIIKDTGEYQQVIFIE